ncbi:MAG: glycosyltransferase, partial [Candidatus Saccharibacteria bacterium]|nr:glycosyltransferase [Candidatus Saccharibacteria bacterium]
MKITFVVLHYQNIEDTERCVGSVLSQDRVDGVEKDIIIVDNGSPNGSGKILAEKYRGSSLVTIKQLVHNLGFSKANNIGFKIAKAGGADIIIFSNNDIEIRDRAFVKKLKKFVALSGGKYAILAPDIINLDNNHQNPLRDEPMELLKAKKNVIYKKIVLLMLHIPILRRIIFNYENTREKKWLDKYYETEREAGEFFVPFGAFLIYLQSWVKKESLAFPSDTFMYMEEDYLGRYIKNKKYAILYEPNLKVYHADGGSVEFSTNGDVYAKMIFRYKEQTKALR